MKTNIGLENCASFINCHTATGGKESYLGEAPPPRWFVTISRQGGCNAHGVGEKLAGILQAQEQPGTPPWTIFDRNLVEKVLADHHLPQRLREFMPEDRHSEIADILEELFELHPPAETMLRQTNDTVLRLAELGGCILIGRAANLVTRRLRAGFHVRLVGSLARRAERMVEYEKLDPEAGLARVREQDQARARYVKKYFHAHIDAAEHYHLVLNTDHFDADQSARIIGEAMLQLAPRC
jgi:cytidylate kinase